jgi:cytochrome c553
MRFTFTTLFIACAMFTSIAFSQAQNTQKAASSSAMERGKMLVTIGGCDDCHSPKTMTAQGPQIDMTRRLSGHPADQKLPELPTGIIAPDKWGAVTTNDLTGWYGPWGASFTANLTSDKETGLGSWTEQMFIQAMRTGKHMGAAQGRPILPPMPWQSIGTLSDADLKAIFGYLKSLKPVKNAVPDPIPPQAPAAH